MYRPKDIYSEKEFYMEGSIYYKVYIRSIYYKEVYIFQQVYIFQHLVAVCINYFQHIKCDTYLYKRSVLRRQSRVEYTDLFVLHICIASINPNTCSTICLFSRLPIFS